MYLAKNLRYLRLKNGLSQDYIADRLGYKSYTTIQKWEMGISEPSLGILSKLSALYNVDMDAMYSMDLEMDSLENDKKVKRIPLFCLSIRYYRRICSNLCINSKEGERTWLNSASLATINYSIKT
jgi:transcriptional regulator with XRE-family HTH domain